MKNIAATPSKLHKIRSPRRTKRTAARPLKKLDMAMPLEMGILRSSVRNLRAKRKEPVDKPPAPLPYPITRQDSLRARERMLKRTKSKNLNLVQLVQENSLGRRKRKIFDLTQDDDRCNEQDSLEDVCLPVVRKSARLCSRAGGGGGGGHQSALLRRSSRHNSRSRCRVAMDAATLTCSYTSIKSGQLLSKPMRKNSSRTAASSSLNRRSVTRMSPPLTRSRLRQMSHAQLSGALEYGKRI